MQKTFEPNKTIKELGIDITRKFVVVEDYAPFCKGDILALIDDDETEYPCFKRLSDKSYACIPLSFLAYADEPEQEQLPKTRKLKETYLFTHNEIKIYVNIDYYYNKISLVEPEGNQGIFKDKKWLFAKRSVEYMGGWLNILEAMQEAIKDAKKKYEWEMEETSKFNEDMTVKKLMVKKWGN